MNRGTLVYVITFAVLAIGLWLVFRAGSRLRAPTDLAGKWEIHPQDAANSAEMPGSSMFVEQSGKYFQIRFDAARPINLKLAEEEILGADPDPDVSMRLRSEGWEMTARGHPEQQQLIVTFKGPEQTLTTFKANRTERALPAAAKPAKGAGHAP